MPNRFCITKTCYKPLNLIGSLIDFYSLIDNNHVHAAHKIEYYP